MSTTKNQQPYFPHYANSRNEDGMIKLRMQHGCMGYGVYYMLLERLRMADGYKCTLDYKILAFDLRCDESLIESVICDFGLFEIGEDGTFSSFEMNEYMRFMEERKQKRVEAARKAAEARWNTKTQENSVSDIPVNDFSSTELLPVVNFPEEPPRVIDEELLRAKFGSLQTSIRLDKEIVLMLQDRTWSDTVMNEYDKSEADLYDLLAEFRKSCVLDGKKGGHNNLPDAQSHFRNWMNKVGDMNNGVLKTARQKSKKEKAVREYKDKVIEERNQMYSKMEQEKQSPADYIRNKGYDPAVVTMAMVMRPGFAESNPPTHPEWIGQFCGKELVS